MTGPSTNNRPSQKTIPEKTIYVRVGDYDMIVEWDEHFSLRLDIEGRWCSMREGDVFFRRLLDGQVVSYTDSVAMPKNIDDVMEVHQRAQRLSGKISELIQSSQQVLCATESDVTAEVLVDWLGRADEWTPDRFTQLQEDFQGAYSDPVEILPPDRYCDLVVFPTLGCPNGQCSFCAFYRQRPFQILSSKDYEDHLEAVKTLFGRSLGLRTGLFLGSANALAMPQNKLLETIKLTKESLEGWLWPRGLAAFWDPDHSPQRSVLDWQDLMDAGLTRVFVGLETGWPELREKLGKSADLEQLVNRLSRLKESGTGLGIIVLSGISQSPSAATHHRLTTEVIKLLDLGQKDIVYVSPFKESMNPDDLKNDTQILIDAISQASDAQVAKYQMDQFRYYT